MHRALPPRLDLSELLDYPIIDCSIIGFGVTILHFIVLTALYLIRGKSRYSVRVSHCSRGNRKCCDIGIQREHEHDDRVLVERGERHGLPLLGAGSFAPPPTTAKDTLVLYRSTWSRSGPSLKGTTRWKQSNPGAAVDFDYSYLNQKAPCGNCPG